MNKKPNKDRVVYSTNPGFKEDEDAKKQDSFVPSQQTLYVSLERLKGGKIATIVSNFTGSEKDLEALGKQLKTKCGGGGTVKDGNIIVQGEHREKMMEYLSSLGYKTKRKGG
jgi:translation initiation factor 1